MKKLCLSLLVASLAQAATLTWNGGAGDDNWSSGANWSGGTGSGPTNGDSVVLTPTAQSRLDYAWTIESGQSLTSTTSGNADEFVLQSSSVLTLATGGTLDIGFMRPRFSSGSQFIIQPGASLDVDYYGLANISAEIKFVADANGVTPWNISIWGNFGQDDLIVDLSAYDISNGTTLVLVDVDDVQGQFATVTLSENWNADIDYAYDQGGGDLAIALTNISQTNNAVTTKGTLKAWLDHYALVTGSDYDAADLLDSDSDGKLNWEEYVAGTDPTGVQMATVSFTLVEGSSGNPDTLTFAPPNTPWYVEASSDDVEWGMLPGVSFVVQSNGTVVASIAKPAALSAGGTYRVVEKGVNSKLVIFLTQGQSNMVGWSAKSEGYYHMDDYPRPNMYQLSRGQTRLEYDAGAADSIISAFQPLQVTYHRSGGDSGYYVSLDFYFAREYAKDHPDEDILIIKNAKGGSGFVNNFWNDGDSMDGYADPYLAAAMAQVSGQYASVEFGGILWHQGEADAKDAASAAAYASQLTALFSRHRNIVSNRVPGAGTQVPVVLGTMIPDAIADNTTGFFDDIDAVHRDIGNLLTNASFADLSSISGRSGLHFVADGYQEAGENYYEAWLDLKGVTGKGTSRAWLNLYGLVAAGNYEVVDRIDSDGDGKLNWEEYQSRTNPTGVPSQASTLSLQLGAEGEAEVVTFNPPNTAWVLKVSSNMQQWDDLPESARTTNSNGTIGVSDLQQSKNPKRFYRLVELGWN